MRTLKMRIVGLVGIVFAIMFWFRSEMAVREEQNKAMGPPELVKMLAFVEGLSDGQVLQAINELSVEEQRWLAAKIKKALPTMATDSDDAKKDQEALHSGARRLLKLFAALKSTNRI